VKAIKISHRMESNQSNKMIIEENNAVPFSEGQNPSEYYGEGRYE